MTEIEKALKLAIKDMQYRQREWAWDVKMVDILGPHAQEARKEYEKRQEAIKLLETLIKKYADV